MKGEDYSHRALWLSLTVCLTCAKKWGGAHPAVEAQVGLGSQAGAGRAGRSSRFGALGTLSRQRREEERSDRDTARCTG